MMELEKNESSSPSFGWYSPGSNDFSIEIRKIDREMFGLFRKLKISSNGCIKMKIQ